MNHTLTAISGLTVGHWTDLNRGTGCTVILCPEGAVAGGEVRGSAPGTRETQLLNPLNTVQKVHAILLAGGSAFGLAAADGVMRWLEERGFGFGVGPARVPLVPGVVIFDLGLGDSNARPIAESGYAACEAASDAPVSSGNVGAGAGATVGKVLGIEHATKGGLGSASLRLENGVIVAALAVVNAFGEVIDPTTRTILAGARGPTGFVDTVATLASRVEQSPTPFTNTTLGVVATNAVLTKVGVTKMAQMAHDGLARVIRPVHTMYDGDTVFALSLGERKAEVSLLGALAAEALANAVIAAIHAAESLLGVPAARDLR